MIAAERSARICNVLGLHARAAAVFVRLSTSFESEIFLSCRDLEVNGKSIMGVMMLAAGTGSELQIRAEGPDAGPAVEALSRLMEDRFGEEQ